jgi:hypothetical protein
MICQRASRISQWIWHQRKRHDFTCDSGGRTGNLFRPACVILYVKKNMHMHPFPFGRGWFELSDLSTFVPSAQHHTVRSCYDNGRGEESFWPIRVRRWVVCRAAATAAIASTQEQRRCMVVMAECYCLQPL